MPHDDPQLAEHRALNDELMDVRLAAEAGADPQALERRIKSISSRLARLLEQQARDGGGLSLD